MTEEEDILIDLYLSGTMPEGDRIAFSHRLETDEELNRRVNLRQELTAYLGGDEPAMRELLTKADHEHYAKKDGSPRSKSAFGRWIVLACLLALGLLAWWWYGEKPRLVEQAPTINNTSIIPGKPLPEDTLKAVPQKEEQEVPSPPIQPETPRKKTPPLPLKSEPEKHIFAQLDPADFTRNPTLDGLISGELRSGMDSTSLSLSSTKDTLLLSEMATINLNGFSTLEPPFEVIVFDNQASSFMDDQPVIRQTLSGEMTEKGFTFRQNLAEVIAPGRYYVLVVNENGRLLVGGSFLVR